MKKNFMNNAINYTEQSVYTYKQNVSNDTLTNDLEYSSNKNEISEVKIFLKVIPTYPWSLHSLHVFTLVGEGG